MIKDSNKEVLNKEDLDNEKGEISRKKMNTIQFYIDNYPNEEDSDDDVLFFLFLCFN
jgi:hypothetical protein